MTPSKSIDCKSPPKSSCHYEKFSSHAASSALRPNLRESPANKLVTSRVGDQGIIEALNRPSTSPNKPPRLRRNKQLLVSPKRAPRDETGLGTRSEPNKRKANFDSALSCEPREKMDH